MIARTVTAALLVSTLTSSCGTNESRPDRSTTPLSRRPQGTSGNLVVTRVGHLPSPMQLPSAVTISGGRVLSLGGLSAADVSTDGVVLVDKSDRPRMVGRLPRPVHDSAAASIGGRSYLFGGADFAPSSDILRVSENGRTSSAGRLPIVASDVAAASIGSRAYVVGGYTGTTPLRSIVSFVPGQPVRAVARLPRPLRYAAVAAAAGSLYIAGGTSGTTAQRAVLRFDPGTRRVTQVGKLPQPLTHAAGASLGGRFYVVGGRGAALDSASSAIWVIDPHTGRVRSSGRLPLALSDIGAASTPDHIVLVGGRDRGGQAHDDVFTARAAR